MEIIADRKIFQKLLAEKKMGYYVYVLRKPDNLALFGGVGTPFYVGIGRNMRMYEHEKEAKKGKLNSLKVKMIKDIWSAGGNILYTIDSWHEQVPWHREEELINWIGRVKDGNGSLTNEQTYSESLKIDGVEVRKYAEEHMKSGTPNAIPEKFKLLDTRLMVGSNKPKSNKSVFGKIYAVLENHPGVTGEELVELLHQQDFSDNKSAYTQSGEVCSAWICGYIEGGFFRKDRLHIQEYRESGGS